MKKYQCLLALLVFLFFIISVNAEIIMIETDIHHLGNDNHDGGLFSLAPLHEGLQWTRYFDLPLQPTSSIELLFDCVDTEESTITINGTSWIIPTHPTWYEWYPEKIDVEPSLLKLNDNVISFNSVFTTQGQDWDDFLFRNVQLVIPEPATISLLCLGIIAVIKKKNS